jgi:hemolysin activation/secretion protein
MSHGDQMKLPFVLAVYAAVIFSVFLDANTGLAAPPLRLPSTVEPGQQQSPPIEAPEGQFDFSITAPNKAPVPKDVDTLRFLVKKIEVEGTTLFRHGDLLPLIEPLIGHEASLRDVMDIAEAIEARYREEGYLLTRAFVPPQRTKDGEFKIQVVEAFIKNILVDGVEGDLKDKIVNILTPVTEEKPLRSATMERALLLVNDLPGVHGVGLLKPSSDEPGAADLQVSVSVQTMSATATIDNRSSRYSGPVIANSDIAINSPLNQGDQLGAGVTRSIDPHKQRGYRVHYTLPLGSSGLVATTSFDRSLGQPGYILAPLGVVTDSIVISQRLAFPLIRSRAMNLTIDAGFSWKSAKTEALGNSLSFDQTRVADVKLSWSQSGWWDGVTSASIDAARGLPVLNASHKDGALLSRAKGDPDFTKLTAELRRAQSIGSELILSLSGTAQHAYNSLLAGEEFALGGYQYGRGFDPAALTGDNGLGGTAELQYEPRFIGIDGLQTYAFYDRGLVWNRDAAERTKLSSAGLGFRLPVTSNADIAFEAARRLYGPAPSVLPDQHTRLFLSLTGHF